MQDRTDLLLLQVHIEPREIIQYKELDKGPGVARWKKIIPFSLAVWPATGGGDIYMNVLFYYIEDKSILEYKNPGTLYAQTKR